MNIRTLVLATLAAMLCGTAKRAKRARAGIQSRFDILDSRFRGNDSHRNHQRFKDSVH